MERQCAWCGASLDEPATRVAADHTVTHGICGECHDGLSTGAGIPVVEFIGSLDQPALLLDADHTIGMVNAAALRLFGDAPGEILGERTGTALDCENAHLPGGCGQTMHCSGCTIRRAVARTHLTGEPQLNRAATVNTVRDTNREAVELVISTARVNDRVLLRIEEIHA